MEAHLSEASRPKVTYRFQEEGEILLVKLWGRLWLTLGPRWDNLPENFSVPSSLLAEDPSFAFLCLLLLLVVVC